MPISPLDDPFEEESKLVRLTSVRAVYACASCGHENTVALPEADSAFSGSAPSRGGLSLHDQQAIDSRLPRYVLAWLTRTQPVAGVYQLSSFYAMFGLATTAKLGNLSRYANAFARTLRYFGVWIRPAAERGGKPTIMIFDPATLPTNALLPETVLSLVQSSAPTPLPLTGPYGRKNDTTGQPRYYPIADKHLAAYLYEIDAHHGNRPTLYPLSTYPLQTTPLPSHPLDEGLDALPPSATHRLIREPRPDIVIGNEPPPFPSPSLAQEPNDTIDF